MHLTELSRHLDHINGGLYTNQEHEGTLMTLRRMVAALPRLPVHFSESVYFLSTIRPNARPTARAI
jgi:hypothetical protein